MSVKDDLPVKNSEINKANGFESTFALHGEKKTFQIWVREICDLNTLYSWATSWAYLLTRLVKLLMKRNFTTAHETSTHETSVFLYAHETSAYETSVHETSF